MLQFIKSIFNILTSGLLFVVFIIVATWKTTMFTNWNREQKKEKRQNYALIKIFLI